MQLEELHVYTPASLQKKGRKENAELRRAVAGTPMKKTSLGIQQGGA